VLAPKGGLRINGTTYREGDRVTKRDARALRDARRHAKLGQSTQRAVDPAALIKDVPPNFGRAILPHVMTFSGMMSTLSKVYRNSDEALRHSVENAHMMVQDPMVMGPILARQKMVALYNWHLQPEDEDDKTQQALCRDLTTILNRIPRFVEYRRILLQAVFYGRYAVQHQYSFHTDSKRNRRTIVSHYTPISGDKLAFRYDDGRGEYDYNQVGVKVTPALNHRDVIAGDRELEVTGDGMAYFLQPWERSRFAVHKHLLWDGDYEDPLSAGKIHGVGLRSFIYWVWYQKQEVLAQLMEIVERTGMGFYVYYYPMGNAAAKAEVEKIAQEQAHTNRIIVPHDLGDPDAYRIEQIPPNTAGIEILQAIVTNHFQNQITKFVLGQTLSTDAAATGLGSGVADLHEKSLLNLARYDAINLEETITRELVWPLRDFNFPKYRSIDILFKIDTESSTPKEDLDAAKALWDMGAELKSADLFDKLGLSMPGPNDLKLSNPQLQQQAAGMMPGMPGMPPGMPPGLPGADPMAGMMGGPEEGGPEDQPPGDDPSEPPGGPPAMPGDAAPQGPDLKRIFGPILHAKHKPAEGQRSLWDEEKHPRDEAGKFAPKAGDKFTLPPVGDRKPMPMKVYGVDDAHAYAQLDTPEHNKWAEKYPAPGTGYAKVPLQSWKHFVNDLSGKLQFDTPSGNHAVDAVAAGKGKWLGKGDDGVAWRVGDWVVKASTTVPFIPENPGHRTPDEAAAMMEKASTAHEKLRRAGVKGLVPIYHFRHEDKHLQVMPFLDTETPLTGEQLWQIEKTLEQIHAAGYTLNDQIQAGVMDDGNAYIYDTGKIRPGADNWKKESDRDELRALKSRHGHPEPIDVWDGNNDDLDAEDAAEAAAAREDDKRRYGMAMRYAKQASLWDEEKHPREDDGKFAFTSGPGGGSSPAKSKPASLFGDDDAGDDEPFTLGAAPKKAKQGGRFEGKGKEKQPPLFSGLNALPGQKDLFDDLDKPAPPDPLKAPREAAPPPKLVSEPPPAPAPTATESLAPISSKNYAPHVYAGLNKLWDAGGTAYVNTHLKTTRIAPKDRDAIKLTSKGGLYLRRGKHWDAITGDVLDRLGSQVGLPSSYDLHKQEWDAEHKNARYGGKHPGELHDAEFLDHAETEKRHRANYFDAAGNKFASSRETPAEYVDLPIGSWRKDRSFSGLYGNSIDQLVELDPNHLELPEGDYAANPNFNPEGRRWDAERYADWIREGKTPPPISVLEMPNGSLKVSDGHRRAAAAKMTGQPIRAWVNWAADTGKKDYEGKPILSGMTDQLAAREHAGEVEPHSGLGWGHEGVVKRAGPERHAKPRPLDDFALRNFAERIRRGDQHGARDLLVRAGFDPLTLDAYWGMIVKSVVGGTAPIKHARDLRAAITAAADATNTDPSDAQREAGNYPKGKLWLHGLELTIENPKGSKRRPEWKPLAAHYGYIRRHEGADGDQVDCYLGPHPESQLVFVIDQPKASGRFDEHKVMFGWTNLRDARKAYADCYQAGWKVGPITALTIEQFKDWLEFGDLSKPIGRYKPAKYARSMASVLRYAERSEERGQGRGQPGNRGQFGYAPKRKKTIGQGQQEFHWVTIDGTHVAINDATGAIEKGPKALVGKTLGGPKKQKGLFDDDDKPAKKAEEKPEEKRVEAPPEKKPPEVPATIEELDDDVVDDDDIEAGDDSVTDRLKSSVNAFLDDKPDGSWRDWMDERGTKHLLDELDGGDDKLRGRLEYEAFELFAWREPKEKDQPAGETADDVLEPFAESPEPAADASPEPALPAEQSATPSAAPAPKPAATAKSKGARAAARAKLMEDFGEKIGGARKETARPSNRPKVEKPADERPAWARRYNISQITKSTKPGEEGKWAIYDTKQKTWSGQPKQVGGGMLFDSKEDAEKSLPLYEVSRSHRVYAYTPKGATEKQFGIFRKLGDRKTPLVKGGFASEQEAMQHMAANPHDVIGHKFPRYESYQYLDRVERKGGKEHRKGDVKPADFQNAFNFRGGEFGNWQSGKDGQTSLNHAYDALHDLADVLGVPPKAVSLNGDLAIAFGARGTGGKDAARAHYEPEKRVINLTKMSGAGTLAHEWLHALDHYLAKEAGSKKHTTTGLGYREKLRDDLHAAMKGVHDALMTKTVEEGFSDEKTGKQRDAAHENLAEQLKNIEQLFDYYGKKKPFTPEQQKQWNELKGKILAGDVGKAGYLPSKSQYGGPPTFENLHQLNQLYKARTGRSFHTSDQNSYGHRLYWAAKHLVDSNEAVEKAKQGATQQRKAKTDFFHAAVDLDKTRASDYYTLPEEMMARAFEGYVMDKLAAKQQKNDYLGGKADNRFYEAYGMKPFPEGDERKAINAAFDKLFTTLKHESRSDERGEHARLYSKLRERVS